MRQETRNIYTIDEHPNKELCFDWIRNNWHDLGSHYVEDMVASLNALAEAVQGKLDYAISIVPDRGEYISIANYSKPLLDELFMRRSDCPLTGMVYDYVAISGLYFGDLNGYCTTALVNDGERIYSDTGLEELCEAGGHEFLEDGTFVETS